MLVGGDGNDTFYGGDKSDYLISTGGSDSLDGGGGSDVFVLAGGTVTISDFNEDEGDTLVIYLEDYGASYDEDSGTVTISDSGTTYDSLEDFASDYVTFSDGGDYDLSEDGGIVTYENSSIDLTDYTDIF
ncbi:hypothetical protein E1297_01025 [Roseibium sp. RKSG952]|nr:hypothetical protein [Roseibium sp. RKSG952]